MTNDSTWPIYRGTGEPHDGIGRLPAPPPWRRFGGEAPDGWRPEFPAADVERARNYLPDRDVVEMVNAALYLRRPLLVTGKPGTGKSTLAYSVAYELGLGPVLLWPITSQSKLSDALYRYDAIGRLQDSNLPDSTSAPDIGRYLRLGPLGTALLPGSVPRVLLIDELDKSTIDLPNDLLNVLEEGQFEITELTRLALPEPVSVMTADPGHDVRLAGGVVRCNAFPFVVVTSNGEREFPPAFLRRCLQITLQPPSTEKLASIVATQLGGAAALDGQPLIEEFVRRRDTVDLATDQLLNAVYLVTAGLSRDRDVFQRVTDQVLRSIGTGGS